MPKKALITGITGQDGSYLAQLLLSKGYEVHGIIRRSSVPNTSRLDMVTKDTSIPSDKLSLHFGDITNSESFPHLLYEIKPDEIYHLAAQSHVRVSFDIPEYTAETTGLGTIRMLESIRKSGINSRFYQASSSEMFGMAPPPQNEGTEFRPRSPYAVAKIYAYWMTVNYRVGYELFATNGILFNHESPRRGLTFLTRKVTSGVANILAGRQDVLYLGNLESKRDWGYAPEYVQAMWLMLQQESPGDFVIGTGSSHSVKEWVQAVFEYAGLDWEKHVKIDNQYFRPTEVEHLVADGSLAKTQLGWSPKIDFYDLVKIMLDADMERIGLKPIGKGNQILLDKMGFKHDKPW